jgi:hypothetical protein
MKTSQQTPEEHCKQFGHAWKCLRCGKARDGVNPNHLKDVLRPFLNRNTDENEPTN